jgi:hypothetical protein
LWQLLMSLLGWDSTGAHFSRSSSDHMPTALVAHISSSRCSFSCETEIGKKINSESFRRQELSGW